MIRLKIQANNDDQLHLTPRHPVYTITASQLAPTRLRPTIVQPCCTICLMPKRLPVSHIKCPIPFTQWKTKGTATVNFAAILAATGHAPNAAAMLTLSICHPKSGATRYAAPNMYNPPEITQPVTRWKGEVK